MPLLHCEDCHHEWEGSRDSKCDWCGGESYVLEPQTSLERALSIHDVGEDIKRDLLKESKK